MAGPSIVSESSITAPFQTLVRQRHNVSNPHSYRLVEQQYPLEFLPYYAFRIGLLGCLVNL